MCDTGVCPGRLRRERWREERLKGRLGGEEQGARYKYQPDCFGISLISGRSLDTMKLFALIMLVGSAGK